MDLEIVAVEPSARMRAQRPGGLVEAIDATAEDQPFADKPFDAASAETRPTASGTLPTAASAPNCIDGFGEAYYGRSERLLDPDA